MKQLLTGLLSILLLQPALWAQPAGITITGKVVDKETAEPVPGATVWYANGTLEMRAKAVAADANGRFTLVVTGNDNTTLRASSVGYYIKRQVLKKDNLQDVIIQLEKIPIPYPGLVVSTVYTQQDPVEVRGVRAGAKAPFSKTNLNKTALEKNNLGQDIPFLLNQTPSVVVNSDAGAGIGYTGLRIRGTDATRINMTINGIPYNDAESQGIFFVNLPDFVSSVSSLQIQRGVGGSTNGAGSFGATLSFSTSENNQRPYAEVNNSYGSFNSHKHTIKAGTGLLNGGFTVDARLSSIQSDGYIDRAESDLRSYFVSLGWRRNKTTVNFNVISGSEKTYQAWNGVPESMLRTNRTYNASGTEKPGDPYDNEVDNYKQDHYQLLFNHAFTDHLNFNVTSFLTKGKGYYEQYKAGEEYGDYGLPEPVIGGTAITETDLVRQLWLQNDFFGQTFSLQYNKRNTSLIYGGAWTRFNNHHFGEVIWAQYGIPKNYRWYSLPANKTDLNNFVKWQQQLNNRLSLYADLQYRHVNYRLDGFRNNPLVKVNNTYNFINPKLGITYQREKSQFSLSYALANKEPNRDDFEAGITEQPKHETLHDVELNASTGIGDHTTLGATLYYMGYRNQLILTGRINDVGAYTRINVPNSYRTGVELQATRRLGKYVNIVANLALSRNKIRSFNEFIDDYDNGGQKTVAHSHKDIALSPAVTGAGTISITRIKNLDIRLLEKYVSRQYLDNTEDKSRSLNSFFVQDVVLDYRLPIRAIRECRILLQANNLFNKKYEPNGYTFSYYAGGQLTTENFYFPMAGRNFMAGITIKL